jgi:protocatechuate 3,4-dioxygenase beta subunit
MKRSNPILLAAAAVALLALALVLLRGGGVPASGVDAASAAEPGEALPGPTSLTASAAPSAAPQAPGTSPAVGGVERAPVRTAATRAEEPEEPTGPFLIGRVVDPNGRGVAGATVSFSNGADIMGPSTMRVFGAVVRQAKSGESDASGRYRVEDPGLARPTIEVSAAGYAPYEESDLALQPGSGDRTVADIVLSPGAILSGRVLDSSGMPVAGAELALVDPDDRAAFFNVGERAVADATTDETGAYRLDRLAVGPWAVQVSAEGYPLRMFRGSTEVPGPQATLDFELPVGVSIRGVAMGVPADRSEVVQVRATPAGAMPFAAMAGAGTTSVELGPDGSFELGGLTPDKEYTLELTEPGSGMFAMMGAGAKRSKSVRVMAGDEAVVLEFRPPAAVAFQVIDGKTGQPVERFEAFLGAPFNQRSLNDASGEVLTYHADGRAVFADLYADDYQMFGSTDVRVRIDAPGYVSASVDLDEIVEGEQQDLGRIEVEVAPIVRVVVRDVEDGDPISNARVELRPLPPEGKSRRGFMRGMDLAAQSSKVKTDASGVAELQGIPGVTCKLTVDKGGRAPYVRSDVLVDAAGVEYQVELGPGGDLVVVVTDERGVELPGVEVEHRGPGDEGTRGQRSTSSRGEARFRDLEPGEHAFRVVGDDGMRRVVARMAGSAEGDEDDWTKIAITHGADLRLTLVVESRYSVSGVVRELGRALVGASVSVERLEGGSEDDRSALARLRNSKPGWGRSGARTDAQGAYRIDDLEPGNYALVVGHEGRAMNDVVEFEIASGDERLDLDLGRTVVRGRVLDELGRPVAGVEVEAFPASSADRRSRSRWGDFDTFDALGLDVVDVDGGGVRVDAGEGTTARDGSFELFGLPTGLELKLRARSELVLPGLSEPFELDENQELDGLEIPVRTAGSILVRLVADDQAEERTSFLQVRATLELTEDGSEPEEKTVENAFGLLGGNAQLGGLAPGRWRLTAEGRGDDEDGRLGSEPIRVEVRGGDRVEVELSVGPR